MANVSTLQDVSSTRQRYSMARKKRARGYNCWLAALSLFAIGFGMLCVNLHFDGAVWDHMRQDGIALLQHTLSSEIPLIEGGTTFHLTAIQDSEGRWKRASEATSSGSSGTSGNSGSTPSDGSAEGESGKTSGSGGGSETTASTSETSGNGKETTASVIDSSGNGETTTASMFESSGDEEATTASMFESSGSGEETTASMLEASGDVTTAETDGSGETTTQMLEMSGDETTAPIEFSGDETTAPMEFSGDQTTSAIDGSGEVTTQPLEMSGDETTTEQDNSDDKTTLAPGSDVTTAADSFTEATVFEATTAAIGGGDDEGLMVPLYIAIIAGVVGLIVGALAVIAVKAFIKWLKRKKTVTPCASESPSTSMLRDDLTRPPEPNWLMAREDTLMRAMALGQVAVLEFALAESITAGLLNDSPALVKEAESKLNMWKRTRTQLETVYRERDLGTMDEFMARFQESGMKDDTGAYQRCVDLKWNIKHAELNMENAADSRNEAMLISSMGQFETLKLPEPVMATSAPYLNARRVAEELRQEKLLQGRTWDVFRMDLRAAVLSKEPTTISQAVQKFVRAEVPDVYDDVTNANKAMEMLEAERQGNLEVSQKKIEDASFSRDQDALRQSIEDSKKFGATEEDLRPSEKLLRVIEREDALLAELRTLTAEGDMTKLSNAIVVFKTPTIKMVDKTGDLTKAEEVLEKLQHEEKMRKIKEDVYRRVRTAMAVGDPTALENMIKALQSLAATGEMINEALLIEAMSELEACRGLVDYRKRMEAIKSALARTMALENIPEAEELVDQMSALTETEEYTMTTDDSRVLDESRTMLNTLKIKKSLLEEIATVRPNLTLPLIPPNLPVMQEAVGRMSVAEKGAQPFEDVFTNEDSVLLEEAKVNTANLETKVQVMTEARGQLTEAVEGRDYTEIKRAIRNAIHAPFVERKELVEPRKLAVFLDPKARRMAVKRAMRARNIRGLEIALQDFKAAKVPDEELLSKGERTLEKIKKREKRKEKEERRKEREDVKRAADIARLTNSLKTAIASRDTEHLQLALEEFEDSGYDPEDVPVVTEAEELFDTLKIQDLRNRLMDSIKRRDLTGLEQAIDDADYGGYVMDVKEEYDIAKDLLYHLRELNNLREAISEMSRSLISEIHKYPMPPPLVHQVMAAAFTLLGESPKKMKSWAEVQTLLGKLGHNSITRRVRNCVPGDIPIAAVKKAEQLLAGLKLNELSEISKGAATFYAWCSCMMKEQTQLYDEQQALADMVLPDIGLPDRPVTRVGDYAWVEENA